MSFKSLRIMYCQFFFRGLSGFLFVLSRFQFKAWFGIIFLRILKMLMNFRNIVKIADRMEIFEANVLGP